MRLRQRFEREVTGGKVIYTMLASTSTGTGFNSTSGNRVGLCVRDSSASKWFLCTATAGTGTWVAIN